MKLKKINAIVSRIASIALLLHVICTIINMLFGLRVYIVHKVLAEATAIPMFLHVVLSIIIVVFVQRGPIFKGYKRDNIRTIIQRDSGVLVLVVTFWHMNALKFMAEGVVLTDDQKLTYILVEILFFALAFTHLWASFSKSLISTGSIKTDADVKRVDRNLAIVCSVLFVISFIAIIVYLNRYMGIGG